jgi:hypothetical protein
MEQRRVPGHREAGDVHARVVRQSPTGEKRQHMGLNEASVHQTVVADGQKENEGRNIMSDRCMNVP